jgi:predicted dehydrogenase
VRGLAVINVGVLGFAHGHVGVYCEQWRARFADELRLVAGWDHDAARAAAAREKFGVELHASPNELLRRDDVDAVVIGAETSLHADLVEQAAAAGKAIVLQKPLCLTLAEADRMVGAVAQHNVAFTLAWQMRVDPQNVEMRRMVRDGAIGRVFMVRRRHGLSTHVWPGFENTWHVKPELNRGMWADDAAHPIDFLLWLLGEPQSVIAEIATLRSERVPDDHGVAVFRYADGTFAEVACSFTCLAGENTCEIVGEDGVIIQNYGDGPSCQVPHPPTGLKWFTKGAKDWTVSPIASPAAHGERIAALAPELLKFLKGQRPPICTAEEGRASLRMVLACYRSAELGRRVIMAEMTA